MRNGQKFLADSIT